MTREEAIEQLKFMRESIPKEPPTYCDHIEEWLDTNKDIKDTLDMAIEALEKQPNTGHWKWVPYSYRPILEDWVCSECKSVAVDCVRKDNMGGIPLYKYCPQCGAKISESKYYAELSKSFVQGLQDGFSESEG